MWLSNMDPGLLEVASTGVSIDEEVTGWLESRMNHISCREVS